MAHLQEVGPVTPWNAVDSGVGLASDLPSKTLHQHVRNRQVAPQRDRATTVLGGLFEPPQPASNSSNAMVRNLPRRRRHGNRVSRG